MNNAIQNNDVALLIFSRTAKAESSFKMIAPNAKANLALSKLLNFKVKQLAKASSLSFFVIDESLQQGQTFGSKLAHAFEQIFTRGYEHVIAIGNDCPSLSVSDLKNAAAKLKKNEIVIGPTKNNGAYLIGMNADTFDQERFAQLSWQSVDTFISLKQYFISVTNTTCFLLPIRNDVNCILDWQSVIPYLEKKLKNIIDTIQIIGKSIMLHWINDFYESLKVSSPYFLRGPPSLYSKDATISSFLAS